MKVISLKDVDIKNRKPILHGKRMVKHLKKKAIKREKPAINRKWVIWVSSIVFISVSIMMLFYFLPRYSDNRRENSYVATVNGEPVSVKEFGYMMDLRKSHIYKYSENIEGVDESGRLQDNNGESYGNRIKREAIDDAVRTKVQQILARQKGVIDDISYGTFLKNLRKENLRRERAVENNTEVIYGPIQYREWSYFDYLFENMLKSVKEKLVEKEIIFTQDELKDYYDSVKGKMYKRDKVVKIRKIFLSYDDKDNNISKAKREEAREKIFQAKARMDKGEEFETLAMEYNTDEKDKKTYGEQTFNKSSAQYDLRKHPDLKKEAQKLSVGQVSDIIEAGNAFYIIKCIEKEEIEYDPLDEVKRDVESKYIDIKYKALINKLMEEAEVKINNEIYDQIKVE